MENSEFKNFVKKKGRKRIYNMEKGGIPFKLIVFGQDEGKITRIMEKPNIKEIEEEIITSGLDVIIDYPEANHYDYFDKDGKKIHWAKTKDNPYWVSGGSFGI